jgi:hypothetical protein
MQSKFQTEALPPVHNLSTPDASVIRSVVHPDILGLFTVGPQEFQG